jgi:RNA polymerase sigma-70 factor (ECF subfamily)
MSKPVENQEIEILKRARLGDEAVLGQIIDKYAPSLAGYLMSLVRDQYQAEDIAQETFIRAFDNLDKFDVHLEFRPWLFKIGRNLALNYLKSSHGRERANTMDIEEAGGLGTESGPELELEKSERRRGVELVLGLLPVHFREVLHLRYMEGLEYDAIAGEMDMPLGTVKTWLYRAKQAFSEKAESIGMEF